MWQLEAKPGSWPTGQLPPVHHAKVKTPFFVIYMLYTISLTQPPSCTTPPQVMWRVAPAALGQAAASSSEIRGWMVLGSHNLSKSAVRTVKKIDSLSLFLVLSLSDLYPHIPHTTPHTHSGASKRETRRTSRPISSCRCSS